MLPVSAVQDRCPFCYLPLDRHGISDSSQVGNSPALLFCLQTWFENRRIQAENARAQTCGFLPPISVLLSGTIEESNNLETFFSVSDPTSPEKVYDWKPYFPNAFQTRKRRTFPEFNQLCSTWNLEQQ